jgi:hypothetical protein
MLNQKQFGCLKFLSVHFNDTQLENEKAKKFFCLQSKNFPPDKRHPGHRPDTENMDHGPDIVFYGPLVNQSE